VEWAFLKDRSEEGKGEAGMEGSEASGTIGEKLVASILQTIRFQLENVPMEMLEKVVEEASRQKSHFHSFGVMVNPTRWIQDQEKYDRNWDTQIAAATKLIELKKIWRQDVPLAERVAQELEERQGTTGE
jgi:hypothetical protein